MLQVGFFPNQLLTWVVYLWNHLISTLKLVLLVLELAIEKVNGIYEIFATMQRKSILARPRSKLEKDIGLE